MRPPALGRILPNTSVLTAAAVLCLFAFSAGTTPSAADAGMLAVIAGWISALDRKRRRRTQASAGIESIFEQLIPQADGRVLGPPC